MVDKNGEPVPGVLVSLSSDSYRNNSATNETGHMTGGGLFPSVYVPLYCRVLCVELCAACMCSVLWSPPIPSPPPLSSTPLTSLPLKIPSPHPPQVLCATHAEGVLLLPLRL